MTEPWVLPLSALIISTVLGSTAISITIYGLRNKANADYVRVLEARVDHAERALERCEARSSEIEARALRSEELAAKVKEENFDLLRRLMHVETITRAREG